MDNEPTKCERNSLSSRDRTNTASHTTKSKHCPLNRVTTKPDKKQIINTGIALCNNFSVHPFDLSSLKFTPSLLSEEVWDKQRA